MGRSWSGGAPTGPPSYWQGLPRAGAAGRGNSSRPPGPGNLGQAFAAVPSPVRQLVANAAGAGFLTGLNDVLTLAGLLSFVGAVTALWLVRQHEIQRPAMAPEGEPQSDALPEAADALGSRMMSRQARASITIMRPW